MNAKKEKYSSSFFFSLLLHIIILFALLASFDFSAKMFVLENSDQKMEVINARVLTSLPKPEKAIPKPPKVIPKPIVQKMPEPEVQPVKKNVIAISDKKEKKLQQDKLAAQMLADINKQKMQQIKQKKIKQKTLANEFEKDLKQMAAKSLQQDMLQEQKKMAGARTQKVHGEVDKYKALILQTISQNWLIPPSVNKNLSAELMIRVAPGGIVLDVQIIKSSGDEGLDNSARSAVFKASPLPVPKDSDAFEPFRQFVLKVRPKDILNAENWES